MTKFNVQNNVAYASQMQVEVLRRALLGFSSMMQAL